MIRLYLSSPLRLNEPVLLSVEQYHYLCHVMRLKTTDSLLCFNGTDGEWEMCIQETGKKQWHVIPKKQTRKQNSVPFCALCPALIKKDNFDWILQKATELNVSDIYPLKLAHSVLSALNMQRAESILIEAAEQSERLTVPHLHPVMDLKTFLQQIPEDADLYYLSEREATVSKTTLSKQVAFIIGPEGGFAPEELHLLSAQKRAHMVHFPATILRAETAAIAILSCWQLSRFTPQKK